MRAVYAIMTVFVTLQAPSALAQSANLDPLALALFSEGRALTERGDFVHACPKFEAAARLTQWLGVQLNLADCYAQLGRTASAWVLFRKAAEHADREHDERAAYARARADALERALSRLEITAHDLPENAQLRLDHQELHRASWDGAALPIDPGEHLLEVTAPGRAAWSKRVTVTHAVTLAVEVPALATLSMRSTKEPSVTAVRPRRWVALSLGSAGALLVGSSLLLGVDAKLSHDAAVREHCDARLVCDVIGYEAIGKARRRGNAATILGGFGVAAVAGAAVLYFVTPREPSPAPIAIVPVATPSSIGVSIEGSL